MEVDKKSAISDAIGNLYRAAFFLARGKGEEKLAVSLIEEAAKKLPNNRLNTLLKKYSYPFKSQTNQLILAEKILDEYLLLK